MVICILYIVLRLATIAWDILVLDCNKHRYMGRIRVLYTLLGASPHGVWFIYARPSIFSASAKSEVCSFTPTV